MRSLTLIAVLVLGAGALQGCEQIVTSAAFDLATTDSLGIFRSEDVNMTQKNYAAADYLLQQSRTYIDRGDVIKAQALIDEDEARVQSKLGRKIPEQVGIRLSQIGYNVDLSEVSSGQTGYLENPKNAKSKPDLVLSGTYLRRPQELDISLRMTEVETGRVVGVFDYIMPMNREISEMSKPEARIYQVDQN